MRIVDRFDPDDAPGKRLPWAQLGRGFHVLSPETDRRTPHNASIAAADTGAVLALFRPR
jgi:hypothetical protein